MKAYLVMTLILLSIPYEQAFANAAAIIIMNQQKDNGAEEIPLPPSRNDGFVSIPEYFRDGPQFKVCMPEQNKKVVAMRGYCANKVRIKHPWYSWKGYHYEYEKLNEGVDVQAYLDKEFGEGITEYVGVSSRRSYYSSSLIVFYKIPDRKKKTKAARGCAN